MLVIFIYSAPVSDSYSDVYNSLAVLLALVDKIFTKIKIYLFSQVHSLKILLQELSFVSVLITCLFLFVEIFG